MEAIRIRTHQAISGMIVAADIYSYDDQLIIKKGSKLDDRMITKLRFFNVHGLFVYKNDPSDEDQREETYIAALRNTPEFKNFNLKYNEFIEKVKDIFDKMLTGDSKVDIEGILTDIGLLLKEGRNGVHILEMLHGIRDYDDLTYVHSLNVSLICNIFAGWLKMSNEETKIITLAGLFHDIGKLLIPQEILTKAGKLTAKEYEEAKLHTIKGYHVLKDLNLDVRIKHSALLHHERCDGSGYPNGLTGEEIENYSKIVAIADVYDAMTCNRRYRKAICPFDVVERFEHDGFLKFDSGYLMVFLEKIIHSYLHNSVRLSDGREGEVVMINKRALSRPVIRCGDIHIDLSKEKDLTIDSIL